MLSKPKIIIFDWDNTIIDSWPIIHGALEETFIEMGLTPWTLEETKRNSTKSLRDNFPKIFGDKWQIAGDAYYKSFRKRHLNEISFLELAKETLELIRSLGIYNAVLSNKKGPTLREEIKFLEIDHLFDVVVGSEDCTYDKPDIEPVRHIISQVNQIYDQNITAGNDIWFVGDSVIDIECAVASKCLPIFFGSDNFERDSKKELGITEQNYDNVISVKDYKLLQEMLKNIG